MLDHVPRSRICGAGQEDLVDGLESLPHGRSGSAELGLLVWNATQPGLGRPVHVDEVLPHLTFEAEIGELAIGDLERRRDRGLRRVDATTADERGELTVCRRRSSCEGERAARDENAVP